MKTLKIVLAICAFAAFVGCGAKEEAPVAPETAAPTATQSPVGATPDAGSAPAAPPAEATANTGAQDVRPDAAGTR